MDKSKEEKNNIILTIILSVLRTALKVSHMNLTTPGTPAASADFILKLLRKSKWNSEIRNVISIFNLNLTP